MDNQIQRGEKIRILVSDLECADVFEGQILEVIDVTEKFIRTAPKGHAFSRHLEGRGWRRVEREH